MKDYVKTEQGYAYEYPRAAVTTDSVIFGFDGLELQVLLIKRGGEPYKDCWAFPGGFLEMNESVEQCAFRELKEETGLEPEQMEQFGVFSAVDRDPRGRVITVAFYALIKKEQVAGGDDAADARWFPINALPSLAFDHSEMLREALAALKRDIYHQPVGFRLLSEQFTMPQLQRLYEAILGEQFDRRNFQKKMLSTGILEEQGIARSTGHRPGRLFSFKKENYEQMKESDSSAKEF